MILKALNNALKALNYLSIFQGLSRSLMSFESYMGYREYQTINHKSYNVNHFLNESINSL